MGSTGKRYTGITKAIKRWDVIIMQQKLIVLSADALTNEDMTYLVTLPNFQKYLAGGCCVKQVRSIYPTCTYPCHTTMRTGVWPDKHGVVCNYGIVPGELDPPYEWDNKVVRWEEDIFRAAKRAGLTTASICWPVTGNHPYIDYLIAECWPKKTGITFLETFKSYGSSEEVLEIARTQMEGYSFDATPAFEKFQIRCACEFIKKYQPDLLMLHPGNVDGYKHKYGISNEHVTKGIEEIDQFIGEIMGTVEESGLLECTNFVLTSDHGQIDVERYVSPNVKLIEAGLMHLNESGEMDDWEAYCMTNGSSALVYLKNPSNREVYDKTWKLLKHMSDEEVYGFTEVYTEPEMRKKEHFGGDFSFVLETDGYTAFNLRMKRPYQKKPNFSLLQYAKGQHGHSPDIGAKPVFAAKGPAFREKVTIETANLIDQAPTYARILGVELKKADGKVIEEFIR